MPLRVLVFAAALPLLAAPVQRVTWQPLSTTTGDLPSPGPAVQQTASLVVDVDKDGRSDFIIASRREGANVVLYRRTAYGWAHYLVDNDHLPIEAGGVAMDVDGDSDEDIIFGEDNSGNKVWWWENPYPHYDPGRPWKRRAIKNSGGNKHHDQLVGDFDGDGKEELVFWNQGKAARKLWLARVPADPKTAEAWPLTEIFAWQEGDYEGLARADVDRDGLPDIIGGGMWFKFAGGKFEPRVIDAGAAFSRVAAGQLKKGGRPELVIAPGDRDGKLRWYELVGDKWVAHDLLDGVIHGHSLDIGDVDGDGNADILCGEMRKWGPQDHAGARMWVFYGDGAGNFTASQLPAGYGHHEAKLADLDGDGRLDILDKPYIQATPAVNVWMNRAAPRQKLRLDRWQRHVIDAQRPWRALFVYPADIDGDGRKDIVTGAWWYRNPGAPGSVWERRTIGAPLNNAVAIFDFDSDGRLDILGSLWNGAGRQPEFVWARNHGGEFTVFQNVAKGEGDFLQGIAAARYAGGGPVEVALSWHKFGNSVQMLTAPANPAKEPWTWRKLSDTTQDEQLSAGDIDRDGRLDLLLGTRWLRNSGEAWTTHVVNTTGGHPDRNRLADVNGDGRLDAVVGFESISVPGKLAWYEQPADATAAWTEHVIAPGVTGPMSLDVADMDGDGDLDVVVGEHNLKQPETARLLMFENLDGKGGKWATRTASTGDEHHDGAQVVDIDGDGDLDVISIGWGHPRVLLFENKAIDHARPVAEDGGRFLRLHWFQPGQEQGNIAASKRFRVSAPETVLHPAFGSRKEVKSSGMMQILAREDLSLLDAADLYLELWGGHNGTANKRVSLNGRKAYPIPEVGTASQHCTHQYPVIALKLTDLVNGYNAVQFACDRGTAGWGHYIVEGAAIRAVLKPGHPDLKKAGLAAFQAAVEASPAAGKEAIKVRLAAAPEARSLISAVRFQGYYQGYDENGDTLEPGWHGYTLSGKPFSYLGEAAAPPYALEWDTSMLPEQQEMAVRAYVYFKNQPDLVYITPPLHGLATAAKNGAAVRLYTSFDLPAPFNSRVKRKKTARIQLDVEPASIERAQLHIAVWDGGCGTIKECVSLNGQPLPVTRTGAHDLIYSVLDLDPRKLRKGANTIEMMSDTEEHGVEIMLPGPALMVRTRQER